MRNEIKKILKTHLPIGKVIASKEELDEPLTKIVNLQANKVLDDATNQILALIEGIVPPPKSENSGDDRDNWGYNQCRADILEKMK